MSFSREVKNETGRPVLRRPAMIRRFEPSKQPSEDSFTQQLLSDGHITIVQLLHIFKII